MGACKELLKDLEYYSMHENGLEVKKSSNRKQYNFKRAMDAFDAKKQDEQVKARYEANIEKAKALVGKFGIVHNTSIDSVIGIIQNGSVLSIDEMEKRDISFNFRITYRGINDEMHNFVFGSVHQGDPIYGLYELKLRRDAETLADAQFMPKSYITYSPENMKDYFMDIKDWRIYLAEEIALNHENPEKYLEVTPVHLRPEFLFTGQIPVTFVESIVCANEKAAGELTRRIKKEFGENNEILSIVKVASEQ